MRPSHRSLQVFFAVILAALVLAGFVASSGASVVSTVHSVESSPRQIAAGPDGALWFTDLGGNKIGRITTAGKITEFAIPTVGSWPGGIAAGPDGALWFTELAGRIGRVTTAGAITEFASPVISRFRLTHKVFAVGRRSTPTFAAATTKPKVGARFDYTLDKAATVRIVIARGRSGRREGTTCVAPTKKLARAKKCIRIFERGTLTRASHRGVNRVAFSGRIRSKALTPGNYQATLTATDAAKNTSTATTTFTIATRLSPEALPPRRVVNA